MNLMTDSPLHRLTPDQRRILRELHRNGWNYKRTAKVREVAVPSVRTAVSRMLRDTGLQDRAQLAYLLAAEDVATGRIDPARPLEPIAE